MERVPSEALHTPSEAPNQWRNARAQSAFEWYLAAQARGDIDASDSKTNGGFCDYKPTWLVAMAVVAGLLQNDLDSLEVEDLERDETFDPEEYVKMLARARTAPNLDRLIHTHTRVHDYNLEFVVGLIAAAAFPFANNLGRLREADTDNECMRYGYICFQLVRCGYISGKDAMTDR